MTDLNYTARDPALTAEEFVELAHRAWPGDYSVAGVEIALGATINITARTPAKQLVGSVRVLTDGYFFGTIPELMVDPDFRGNGVARRLMQLAWEASPTSLYFGAQPGREGLYQKLGYEPGLPSFFRRKARS